MTSLSPSAQPLTPSDNEGDQAAPSASVSAAVTSTAVAPVAAVVFFTVVAGAAAVVAHTSMQCII